MGSLIPATAYGKRLMPHIVDEWAILEPDRHLYTIPLTTNPSGGFLKVGAKKFADAVNRAAFYLEEALGGKSKTFETLGYTGPSKLSFIKVLKLRDDR